MGANDAFKILLLQRIYFVSVAELLYLFNGEFISKIKHAFFLSLPSPPPAAPLPHFRGIPHAILVTEVTFYL